MEKSEKTTVLTNGIKWMRYIFLIVAIFAGLDLISSSENMALDFMILSMSIGLFILLGRARKLKYDSENLYIINGSRKMIVPFSTISSIKRSRSKVNGSRFWILTYLNAENKKKVIRYFPGIFHPNFKHFPESVRKVNQDVIIWYHPFFNH